MIAFIQKGRIGSSGNFGALTSTACNSLLLASFQMIDPGAATVGSITAVTSNAGDVFTHLPGGPYTVANIDGGGSTATVDLWYCLAGKGGATAINVSGGGVPTILSYLWEAQSSLGGFALDVFNSASSNSGSAAMNGGSPTASGNDLFVSIALSGTGTGGAGLLANGVSAPWKFDLDSSLLTNFSDIEQSQANSAHLIGGGTEQTRFTTSGGNTGAFLILTACFKEVSVVLPALNLGQTHLFFTNTSGPQTVALTNLNPASTLNFTAVSNDAWLAVTPTSGSANTNLQISVNTTGLGIGIYSGSITIDSGCTTANAPQTILVNLCNGGASRLVLSPSSLSFVADGLGNVTPDPSDAALSLSDGAAIGTTVTPAQTWISSNDYSATPTTLVTTVDPSGLGAGNFSGQISISADDFQVSNFGTFPSTTTPLPPPVKISTTNGGSSTGTITLTLPATTAGNSLVCSVIMQASGTTVSSVVSGSSHFSQVGGAYANNSLSAPGVSSDVWWLSSLPLSTTSATITLSAAVEAYAVVYEVSNLNLESGSTTADSHVPTSATLVAGANSGFTGAFINTNSFLVTAIGTYGSKGVSGDIGDGLGASAIWVTDTFEDSDYAAFGSLIATDAVGTNSGAAKQPQIGIDPYHTGGSENWVASSVEFAGAQVGDLSISSLALSPADNSAFVGIAYDQPSFDYNSTTYLSKINRATNSVVWTWAYFAGTGGVPNVSTSTFRVPGPLQVSLDGSKLYVIYESNGGVTGVDKLSTVDGSLVQAGPILADVVEVLDSDIAVINGVEYLAIAFWEPNTPGLYQEGITVLRTSDMSVMFTIVNGGQPEHAETSVPCAFDGSGNLWWLKSNFVSGDRIIEKIKVPDGTVLSNTALAHDFSDYALASGLIFDPNDNSLLITNLSTNPFFQTPNKRIFKFSIASGTPVLSKTLFYSNGTGGGFAIQNRLRGGATWTVVDGGNVSPANDELIYSTALVLVNDSLTQIYTDFSPITADSFGGVAPRFLAVDNTLANPHGGACCDLTLWNITSKAQHDSFPVLFEWFDLSLISDLVVPVSLHTPSGTVSVGKFTNPAGFPEAFTIQPSWGAAFTLRDGQSQNFTLPPGVYFITEDIPEGWTLEIEVE